MERKARDVQKQLTKKFGFTPTERGDRHDWFELTVAGVPKISVMFSHGERDIGDRLQNLLAQQLRVRRNYFNGMIDCTKNKDDYYRVVVEAPYPPPALR